MAAVRIDSGPIEATDLLRDVPQGKWHDLMLARRRYMEINLGHDCRCVVEFVNDAKLMFKALGFKSVADMVKDGYGLQPEEIAVAVEWLTLNPPDEPIGFEEVTKLGKRGGDRRSEKAKADQIDIINLKKTQGGTGRAYILARLDRDGHAELAAKVRAGKLSANAAAIEAGFRKQLTPLERIRKLLPRLTASERRALLHDLEQMTKNTKATARRDTLLARISA